MSHAAPAQRTEHEEAVALVEEMAVSLGLTTDYIRDLAERVTGQPWDDLDSDGAEAVADLLAEALHRTLTRIKASA